MNHSLDDIDGVLDYGHLLRGTRLRLLWVFLFVPLLLPLATLGVAVTVWSGEMSWDANVVYGLIGADIFGLFVLGSFVYILVRNSMLKKDIVKWLDDSCEVRAFVQRPDLYGRSNIPEQLEITFKYNETQIRVLSTAKPLRRWRNKVFLKYANSSIMVIYSPKYNRILFQNLRAK